MLSEIRAKYPVGFGKSITKYAEPFVGGGAVLFDVLNNYQLESVYISDINRELITTYLAIRDNVLELSALLNKMQNEYWDLNIDERKEYYYGKRDAFNNLKSDINGGNEILIASLFIFLNRTCFNGLYRVNSKGFFNVPIGNYKKPLIYDKNNIIAVSRQLERVQIICGDYRKSRNFIDENTLAYFDPPYRPISKSSNFTAYATDGFGDDEQRQLALFINEMSIKGAYIIASNSDPKNMDSKDEFFDSLYHNHKIKRINANRMINSSSEGRGKIKELLIINY